MLFSIWWISCHWDIKWMKQVIMYVDFVNYDKNALCFCALLLVWFHFLTFLLNFTINLLLDSMSLWHTMAETGILCWCWDLIDLTVELKLMWPNCCWEFEKKIYIWFTPMMFYIVASTLETGRFQLPYDEALILKVWNNSLYWF